MSSPKSFFKDFTKRLLLSPKKQPQPEYIPPDVPRIPATEVQNRALSIRQPFVEQIMLGIKKVEYRSQPTHIRGRIYVYASLTPGPEKEFARISAKPGELPTGVIIGTVQIIDCTGEPGDYEWHLAYPERLETPFKPEGHPNPAWFFPFKK
jgi:hypothetical protein